MYNQGKEFGGGVGEREEDCIGTCIKCVGYLTLGREGGRVFVCVQLRCIILSLSTFSCPHSSLYWVTSCIILLEVSFRYVIGG